MAYQPPPEQTLKAAATRKRLAASKREREADHLRAEADDLDRRWIAFLDQRDDAKATPVTAPTIPANVVAQVAALLAVGLRRARDAHPDTTKHTAESIDPTPTNA